MNKAEANRRNAQHSTGPRTAAGKAVAAMNAMKHGILAERAPVLPTERREAFAQLRAGVLTELAPRGVLETELAERAVALLWRLRRVQLAEAGLFAWHLAEAAVVEAAEGNPLDAGFYVTPAQRRARTEADMAQRHPAVLLAVTVRAEAEALGVLERYEAALERRLAYVLRELQGRQEARALPVHVHEQQHVERHHPQLPNEPTE